MRGVTESKHYKGGKFNMPESKLLPGRALNELRLSATVAGGR